MFKMYQTLLAGKATENVENTLPEAVRLKLEGVTAISVAVGGDHDVGTYSVSLPNTAAVRWNSQLHKNANPIKYAADANSFWTNLTT